VEHENLDESTRRVHEEIKKARIKERVDALIAGFGRMEREVLSDRTKMRGFFDQILDGRKLSIKTHTWGQFHQNETVEISFDGGLVFNGEYRRGSEPYCDPRLIVRFPKRYYETLKICHYRSGEWLGLLSVQKVRQARAEQERVEEQERKKQEALVAHKESPRAPNSEIARVLGISPQ